jgi:CheY-like chemotaxis protein
VRAFPLNPENCPNNRHGLPLLHIDDNEDDRLLIREAISMSGTPFSLHQADSLDSALTYFKSHSIDRPNLYPVPALLLLDYDLGGGHTGCDFLRWFRLAKKDTITPVTILSGSSGQRHVAECYAIGANYFLTKPSTLERFKAIATTLYLSLAQPELPRHLPEYVPNPHTAASQKNSL